MIDKVFGKDFVSTSFPVTRKQLLIWRDKVNTLCEFMQANNVTAHLDGDTSLHSVEETSIQT
jgi:hypothetical protein